MCVCLCVSGSKCQLLYRSLNVDKRKHFQSQRSLPIPQAICAGLICGRITRHRRYRHMWQSGCVAVSRQRALEAGVCGQEDKLIRIFQCSGVALGSPTVFFTIQVWGFAHGLCVMVDGGPGEVLSRCHSMPWVLEKV